MLARSLVVSPVMTSNPSLSPFPFQSYREKIWDHAAGMLVAQEAGARITDALGKPLDFTRGRTLKNNVGVVVTSGHHHDAALAAVQHILGLKPDESVDSGDDGALADAATATAEGGGGAGGGAGTSSL